MGAPAVNKLSGGSTFDASIYPEGRPDGRMDERDSASANRSDAPIDGAASDDPGPGFISVRGGLIGLGFIWVTAVSAVAAIGAAAYGVTTAAVYLLVAVVAAAVAIAAGAASLKQFGYRE
jgi:hypothetical protein